MDHYEMMESTMEWEHIWCKHIFPRLDLDEKKNAKLVCHLWRSLIWRSGSYVNVNERLIERGEYVEGIVSADRYPLILGGFEGHGEHGELNVQPLAMVFPQVRPRDVEALAVDLARLRLDDYHPQPSRERKRKTREVPYEGPQEGPRKKRSKTGVDRTKFPVIEGPSTYNWNAPPEYNEHGFPVVKQFGIRGWEQGWKQFEDLKLEDN